VAFGRIDAWSDLDLYVVVDDDRVDETFRAVEAALECVSGIRRKCEIPHPPESGIAQAFYRLEGTSEHLLVDLAVLKRSAPDKYLQPEIHGDAVVAFDKSSATTTRPLDVEAFVERIRARVERLRGRIDMFAPFVVREIERGNGVEAIDLYRVVVLDSLLEVLRIRHGPLQFDFRTRYVHRELPPAVVAGFERLAFVRDLDDLSGKHREALAWFHETVALLDDAEVRSRLSDIRGQHHASAHE